MCFRVLFVCFRMFVSFRVVDVVGIVLQLAGCFAIASATAAAAHAGALVYSSNANAPQHTFETLSVEFELEVLQDGVDGVVLLQQRRLQVANLGVVARVELFERLDGATCCQLVQSEGYYMNTYCWYSTMILVICRVSWDFCRVSADFSSCGCQFSAPKHISPGLTMSSCFSTLK